jgi:hypothetical protein
MAKQDHVSGDQPTEPTEGVPPAFKIGAILFFVLLIVIAVVFAPEIAIPD